MFLVVACFSNKLDADLDIDCGLAFFLAAPHCQWGWCLIFALNFDAASVYVVWVQCGLLLLLLCFLCFCWQLLCAGGDRTIWWPCHMGWLVAAGCLLLFVAVCGWAAVDVW